MSDQPLSVASAYLKRSDIVLVLAALAGLVLFIWAMPREHPDAAADATLGEDGAIEASRTMIEERGYSVEGLTPAANFRRERDLVMSVQRRYGRRNAVSVLRDHPLLPAYHWRVEWRFEGEAPTTGDRAFTTLHMPNGEHWGFEQDPVVLEDDALPPIRRVDRNALAALVDDQTAALADAPDSLLLAGLLFTPVDPAWAAPVSEEVQGMDLAEWLETRNPDERFSLGPAEAAAMARYHLRESTLSRTPVELDSVWVVFERGREAVSRARFTGTTLELDFDVQATVDVTATGRLQQMVLQFEDQEADPSDEDVQTASVSTSDFYNGIMVVTLLVLVVGFIVLFVRRLSARLIDARASLRDALLGGVLAIIGVSLSVVPAMWQELPNVGLGLFMVGTTISVAGLAGAGAIFVISCASDALARESWPAKLETITRFRQGGIRTVPSGVAVLRGVALGGVLLGLVTLVLVAFPGLSIDITQDDSLFPIAVLPFVTWLASYGWYTMFIALGLLLGVGTFLYRLRPSGPLVVVGIAVLFALTQISPVSVEPAPAIGLIAGVVGVATGYAFWQYSAITGGLGLLIMFVGWETLPGWIVAGSPVASAPWMMIAFVVALLLFAGVAVMSGHIGTDVSQYVPDYIREMTHQERLQRELEIAREVQQSFLPRKMPKMEGVDLAAMCLPAHEVGGDYYDFITLGDGKLGVAIGDVSGKGIQAAFFMTLAKGFLQTLAHSEPSPAAVLRRLNRLFYENASRGTFISMIYGVLDVEEGTFTFARAGHTPLVQYRSHGEETELVRPGGLGIGLARGRPFDSTIKEQTLKLFPGDALVFYTDGFSEAMNRRKEQYGDTKLAKKIARLGERSASHILRSIIEDVTRFIEGEGRHDDMTMVIAKFEPVEEHAHATNKEQIRTTVPHE